MNFRACCRTSLSRVGIPAAPSAFAPSASAKQARLANLTDRF